MFENLKEDIKFDYKESYNVTDKIEEELVKIEENSHKYASEKFMEMLDKVKNEKEPLNIIVQYTYFWAFDIYYYHTILIR